MNTTTQTSTPASIRPDGLRRRAVEAFWIVFLGTVAWLAYVWVAATVIYAIVIAGVARWGSIDQSLWLSVASNWQRYLVFAAGVTVTTTFLRMLVRNGATRRLLSIGAAATMAGLAVTLAAWNMAGLAVEKVLYDANDWPQALRSDTVFTWGDLPRAGLDSALIVAAYFAAGWIVGVCYTRWGSVGGTVRLLPAAAMEFLVTPDFGGADIGVLAGWRGDPHLAVTVFGGGPSSPPLWRWRIV